MQPTMRSGLLALLPAVAASVALSPPGVALSFAEAGSRLRPTAPPVVILHGVLAARQPARGAACALDCLFRRTTLATTRLAHGASSCR